MGRGGCNYNSVRGYSLRSMNVFVGSLMTYRSEYGFDGWVLVYSRTRAVIV